MVVRCSVCRRAFADDEEYFRLTKTNGRIHAEDTTEIALLCFECLFMLNIHSRRAGVMT